MAQGPASPCSASVPANLAARRAGDVVVDAVALLVPRVAAVVIAVALPEARADRGRAAPDGRPTWPTSTGTGGARAAGPGRRARARAARPRRGGRSAPGDRARRTAADWSCSRRSCAPADGWRSASAAPGRSARRPGRPASASRTSTSASRSGRRRSTRCRRPPRSSPSPACRAPAPIRRSTAATGRWRPSASSPTVSTGHLTVGDWPGGRRSGSIPSDSARRRPRSPNMRGVIGTPALCRAPRAMFVATATTTSSKDRPDGEHASGSGVGARRRFRIGAARDPGARSRGGARPSPRLRRLPQRLVREGGRIPRGELPAGPRPRDRRRDLRARRAGAALDGRPARRRRLVRRQLRPLRVVSPRLAARLHGNR